MPGPPLAPSPPWEGRRVLLGVAGGVAAYKSVQVARDLTRLGAEVDVVTTRSAGEFVRPLTFEAVTGRPVWTDLFEADGAASHIRLGLDAECVCVAPATADLLARLAHGRADDLLTTSLLVARAPVLLCPAMNDRMYSHPQTGSNLRHLAEVLGMRIVGPATGALAAGEGHGPGRMEEPSVIVDHVGRALGEQARLSGRSALVTSGPTREPVDGVRYLGNRSSGRMGHAVARALWLRGADVTLVSGPTGLEAPTGATLVRVETAAQMYEAVRDRIRGADVVVHAAAVADFRPVAPREDKIKRSALSPEDEGPVIRTEQTTDIAADTRASAPAGAVVVGFALETSDLIEHARGKMSAKGFDLIVANPAGEPDAGFESSTNRAVLMTRDGGTEPLERMPKTEMAWILADRIGELLERRRPTAPTTAQAGAGTG